ncbi:MAG: Nif3-like dinuclear metal center hexameric protein [Acidimicrobiia bacterium]|nr:Nif3-like dinuclear metal center hexameric protein [Acidimicrobiia bacterium]
MSERSVVATLEELSASIPWDRAAEWDVSGLTLGDPHRTVRTAAVCHEVTASVLGVLEQEPVDLLITYHPLLFRPVRSLLAGPGPEGLAFRLIRMGVALAVAHTAFDVCPGGAADALADALGLGNVDGFGAMETSSQIKVVTFVPSESTEEVAEAMAGAGGGRIGQYRGCSYRSEGVGAFLAEDGTDPAVGEVGEANRVAEVRLEMIAPAFRKDALATALVAAHPYEEAAYDIYPVSANLPLLGRVGTPSAPVSGLDFCERVAEALDVDAVRCRGVDEGPVGTVAVLPGAGGSLLSEGASAGADLVVTGDVSHHQMAQASHLGVGVIDPGHAPTEAPGVARLAELVGKVVPRTVDLSGLRPGPEVRVRRR